MACGRHDNFHTLLILRCCLCTVLHSGVCEWHSACSTTIVFGEFVLRCPVLPGKVLPSNVCESLYECCTRPCLTLSKIKDWIFAFYSCYRKRCVGIVKWVLQLGVSMTLCTAQLCLKHFANPSFRNCMELYRAVAAWFLWFARSIVCCCVLLRPARCRSQIA